MTILFKAHAKKCLLTLPLLLMCQVMPTKAQQFEDVSRGVNLISNPSFEDGNTSWDIPERNAKIVDDVAYSGKNSLHYSKLNLENRDAISQRITVQAGQRLYFSLWAKGQDVTSKTQPADRFPAPGVDIDVEFRDDQETIISKITHRRTPGGSVGTYDWVQVRGEGIVPNNATNALVSIHLRDGVTGSVWIDDIETRAVPPEQFSSFLLFPNYRGTVLKGDTRPWKFSVRKNDSDEDALAVKNVLRDANGNIVLNRTVDFVFTDRSVEFELEHPANLPIGNYRLDQIFTTGTGAVVLSQQCLIRVVEKMPKVHLDADGFTVVDGKRFFPLGLYLNPVEDSDLRRISDAGFNTILSYHYGNIAKDSNTYLDRANNHHLKVIYSLKEMYPGLYKSSSDAYQQAASYVEQLRAHPALLSWYINDELRLDWIPEINQMYEQTVRLDPDHPTFQMSNHVKEMEKYFNVTDINGTDPYPVNVPYEVSPALTSTYLDTKVTVDYSHKVKGVWIAPQIMDWATYREGHPSQPPTLDEMRYQTYASLIAGAKGLIYYSYFDLWFANANRTQDKATFEKQWPNVAALMKEVTEIIPVVLEDNKVELRPSPGAKIYASALEYQGQLCILLANPYYEPDNITIDLPKGWKVTEQKQGHINSNASNGKITFSLPPAGSGVFRLEKN